MQVCIAIGCVPPACWPYRERGGLLNPGVLHLGGSTSRGGLPNPEGSASGGFCQTLGGVCIQGGLPNPGGSASRDGVCPTLGGVCIQAAPPNPRGSAKTLGGLHPGGSAQPEGSASRGGWADPLPSVNRMTYRCKNITLPQTSFTGGKNRSRADTQQIQIHRL